MKYIKIFESHDKLYTRMDYDKSLDIIKKMRIFTMTDYSKLSSKYEITPIWEYPPMITLTKGRFFNKRKVWLKIYPIPDDYYIVRVCKEAESREDYTLQPILATYKCDTIEGVIQLIDKIDSLDSFKTIGNL
jgi:hypothetical protein